MKGPPTLTIAGSIPLNVTPAAYPPYEKEENPYKLPIYGVCPYSFLSSEPSYDYLSPPLSVSTHPRGNGE
jgi:hypothetical protein